MFFLTALPCSGSYHLDGGAVTWCGWDKLWTWCNYWNARLRSHVYWLRGVCCIIVCVLSHLIWLPLLGVIRKSSYTITCAVNARAGYTWCFGRTSGCLFASQNLAEPYSQNLAVPQDFYCHPIISVEPFFRHCIQWCGTRGFEEQGQCLFIGLATHSPFLFYFFSFLFYLSFGWYCGTGGSSDRLGANHSHALPTFLHNNNNSNDNKIKRFI